MKKFLLSVVAGMSLTTTSMAQTVPSYVPTNGLVGYWGFDGNAQDYSGNGNHGTVNGATLTADRSGNIGKAFDFDGVNDNIVVANSSSFQTNIWTISSWFKTGFLGYNRITSKDAQSNPYNDMSLIILNGQLYISSSANGQLNNPQPLCTQFVADNLWHHVVAIRANSTFQIFIDGFLCTNVKDNMGNLINNNPLYIGSPRPYPSQYFNGKLDDIGIWNRALTQQEITALYMECQYNPTITPIAVNLKVGNDVLFQVTSGGSNPSFQWQTNSNNLGWQNIPNNLNYSGANTVSLTVNNVQLGNHNQPFRVIATSGSCSDTSDVASIHVGDTCLITVHDTLVINRTITGLSAPNNKNTIKVYPNPAKDHVIIHYGNFAMMNGYSVKITNTLGQELFASPINQQTSSVNLSNWINHSLYFVQIIDPQGKTVETRKILIE